MSLFKQEDRLIFSHPSPKDGSVLWSDPETIRIGLLRATRGTFDDLIAQNKSEDVVVRETAKLMLGGALLSVLGWKPIGVGSATGEGVPMLFALDTLQKYLDFLEEKKAWAEKCAQAESNSPSANLPPEKTATPCTGR